jgi:signal transduction histidine kinase
MTFSDKPKNEDRRIFNLKSYEILDTRPENEFEDIVLLVSAICEVPYCLIGFIDYERIWFKSKMGFDLSEISLGRSIWKYALDSKQALLVEDLEADDFFSQLSIIQNGHKIRFFLSLPLISSEGFMIGTLCVMDNKPRSLNEKQFSGLYALSRQIIQNLNLRKGSMKNLLTNKACALGMYTFSMAHEINNALFVSNGYLYHALRVCHGELKSEVNILDILNKIKESNSRITKIINGIKIFSRNAENDPFEIFSTKQIIMETLSICEERCKHENILLSTNLPSEEFFIECHPSEIIQVLINFINNSIDALSEVSHKWIELEVKVIGNNINFAVKDGGRGVPKEIAENLTKHFFTTKTSGKGTGLGLSICKSIIEHHSGEFFFDNHLPTTFGFSLPFHSSNKSR